MAEATAWRTRDYLDLGVIGATHGLSDGFSGLLKPVLALIVVDLGLSTFDAGVLLSVFSGIALFGFMGVVYGPLIMILFTTTLEVYLKYYRPGAPEVTPAFPTDKPTVNRADEEAVGIGDMDMFP